MLTLSSLLHANPLLPLLPLQMSSYKRATFEEDEVSDHPADGGLSPDSVEVSTRGGVESSLSQSYGLKVWVVAGLHALWTGQNQYFLMTLRCLWKWLVEKGNRCTLVCVPVCVPVSGSWPAPTPSAPVHPWHVATGVAQLITFIK